MSPSGWSAPDVALDEQRQDREPSDEGDRRDPEQPLETTFGVHGFHLALLFA